MHKSDVGWQDLSIDAPEPWENLARLSVHSEQRGGALVYGAVASQALATGEEPYGVACGNMETK